MGAAPTSLETHAGGGSGGGIFLHADTVILSGTDILSIAGGNGAGTGGGGGAGQIAIQTNNYTNTGTFNTFGGAGGGNGSGGGNFTFTGPVVLVSEPSAFALVGLIFAGFAFVPFRKRFCDSVAGRLPRDGRTVL